MRSTFGMRNAHRLQHIFDRLMVANGRRTVRPRAQPNELVEPGVARQPTILILSRRVAGGYRSCALGRDRLEDPHIASRGQHCRGLAVCTCVDGIEWHCG